MESNFDSKFGAPNFDLHRVGGGGSTKLTPRKKK